MGTSELDFSTGLPPAARVLVTGGSGFIGTNLVAAYSSVGVTVASLDIAPPRNPEHVSLWTRVDLTQAVELRRAVLEFGPTHVFHLGARTDLDGRTVSDYSVNVEGVNSTIDALRALSPPAARVVVASSRMVCRIGYQPRSDEDYCPSTAYGESKVQSERLVRAATDLPFVLVRPTSIWGPWFDVPYRDFFLNVARGRYMHPRGRRVEKSFGFVGNTAWQLHKVMTAPDRDVVGRTFYLADDPPIEVRDLAHRITAALGQRRPREVPLQLLTAVARAGDLLERAGRRAPLTRFRLANLLTPMVHDLGPLTAVAGKPPYGLDVSVPTTVDWMRGQGLVG